MFTVDGNDYNRFVNLDGITYRIIDYLARSQSKYADNLWKVLAYDTEDCLLRPSLSYEERMKLFYTNNGDASVRRIYNSPFIDDAWDQQNTHLHIYLYEIVPQSHLTSTVSIAFECVVHNKISNIIGDANVLNPSSNPSELTKDGAAIIRYKNRADVLLKSVLADLNGSFVAGVGTLQFNVKLSNADRMDTQLWNNHKFYGYRAVMSTLLSGVSEDNECGY